MSGIVVQKGRTNIITVSLGFDVSGDTLTSEIKSQSGELIATWAVEFDDDGVDGELLLTLDDSVTSTITHATGLMDIKRITAGEPFAIFDMPIEVEFRETITS